MKINGRAQDRLALAHAADYCVQWLKANGLKLMRIEGEVSQPRIIVKYKPACDQMGDDIVVAYERSANGERRYGWVNRFRCQVKWAIPAVNPHNQRREMSNV
jgi:hypothetical protein